MAMIDTLTKAQDDFFAAVEQTNDRVVSTVRNVADNVERAAENAPELPIVNRMKLDNVQVPEFVQELPTPAQFTELYFDFISRSVEMNRAFAEQMVSIFTGGTTKSAKKASAKKAPAKKAAAKPAEAKTEAKADTKTEAKADTKTEAKKSDS